MAVPRKQLQQSTRPPLKHELPRASITIACETPDACHDLYIGEVECTTLDSVSGPDGERQFKQVKDDDGKKGF